jgi:hypothetical protein
MKPTNQQLRQLLFELGFQARNSVEPNCLVMEHPDSRTRLLLPSNKDSDPAREADVLSIRTHLMYRGHLDEAGFDAFLAEGRLRAS